VELQRVPKGATDQETIGTTEDRYGDQRLAIRRHRQQKKRAQGNGGPRQKFAAVRGWFTRRAIPAMRKGHAHRGPGKTCRSGIRVPGRTLGSWMEDPSLKKRQTKVNAVQGTPEGRTCEKRR
jgi:hypothetical protein